MPSNGHPRGRAAAEYRPAASCAARPLAGLSRAVSQPDAGGPVRGEGPASLPWAPRCSRGGAIPEAVKGPPEPPALPRSEALGVCADGELGGRRRTRTDTELREHPDVFPAAIFSEKHKRGRMKLGRECHACAPRRLACGHREQGVCLSAPGGRGGPDSRLDPEAGSQSGACWGRGAAGGRLSVLFAGGAERWAFLFWES